MTKIAIYKNFGKQPYSQKMKVAFHQVHLIDLLEELPKCKILAFILLLPVAMVTKMADKIGLK